jgi:hypothetical protein
MYSSIIVLTLENKVSVLGSAVVFITSLRGVDPLRLRINSKEWLAGWLGFPNAK